MHKCESVWVAPSGVNEGRRRGVEALFLGLPR